MGKFIKKILWKFIVSARPRIYETAGVNVLSCNAVFAMYLAAHLNALQCCTAVILRLGMDEFVGAPGDPYFDEPFKSP